MMIKLGMNTADHSAGRPVPRRFIGRCLQS